MTSLKKLNIEGNYAVTSENVETFRAAVPRCEIKHSELKSAADIKPKKDTDSENTGYIDEFPDGDEEDEETDTDVDASDSE